MRKRLTPPGLEGPLALPDPASPVDKLAGVRGDRARFLDRYANRIFLLTRFCVFKLRFHLALVGFQGDRGKQVAR